MGVSGQRHAPAALSPGKTRYPLYRRLGEPQDRSGRVRKISPPPGFDSRTVQPVASRYTDWDIRSMDQQFQLIHRNSGVYITLSKAAWVVNRVHLDDQGWFPTWETNFIILQSIQTIYEVQLASYSLGLRLFPWE